MHTYYAKLWRNYLIYEINLRCSLRLIVVWHVWAYDARLRSESFAKLKLLKIEEKNMLDNAIPRSTPAVTKWVIQIFPSGRQRGWIKIVLKNKLISSLIWIRHKIWTMMHVADMTIASLNFWLTKFVEVCKDDGEWYPSHSLYSICCGIWRHLEDCKGSDAIRILNKYNQR